MDEEVSRGSKIAFFILIAVLMTIVVVSVFFKKDNTPKDRVYSYDFESSSELEDGFWLVSRWGKFVPEYELVKLRDGILVLESGEGGRTPYIMSAPIDLNPGSVITIKRRVRITRGEEMFAGGLALYQTSDQDLVPPPSDGAWFRRMGDGIALIEYSYDLKHMEKRPGKDVFRFLASDWEHNRNFKLIDPVYDKWVDETIIFDMRINQMTYKIDKDTYKLNSYKLDRPAIRLVMHPYGKGENRIEIENVEITIKEKRK